MGNHLLMSSWKLWSCPLIKQMFQLKWWQRLKVTSALLQWFCGLTLLTQNSRAFSHGAPTPICSASTAIFTLPTVSLAASVIRESIRARWAFCTNHKRDCLTTWPDGLRIINKIGRGGNWMYCSTDFVGTKCLYFPFYCADKHFTMHTREGCKIWLYFLPSSLLPPFLFFHPFSSSSFVLSRFLPTLLPSFHLLFLSLLPLLSNEWIQKH